MLKKALVLLLFWGSVSQAKTLSEMVFDEQMREKNNYVFSNTSVDGLLSLISFGLTSSNQEKLVQYWDGITLKKKSQILSSLNEKTPGINISANYQIWLDQNYFFMPEYLSDVSRNFSVIPETVNMKNVNDVVNRVNSWASKNTNHLIKEVINANFVTPDLVTILANAIYFKGDWKEQFDKSLTSPKEFHGVGLVDTMKAEDVLFTFNEKDKVLVVELPFKGDRHSMILAMPAQLITTYDEAWDEYLPSEISYRSGDIKKVFKNYILNSKAFKELEENYSEGSLEMPKFTIETSVGGIEDMLSQLGLANLFQPGALFKMINDPTVQLSKVLQKAKIIVNEEGAEAAAVTIAGPVVISEMSPPLVLKLNGPFAYMILDKTNKERLFEGVVLNPGI